MIEQRPGDRSRLTSGALLIRNTYLNLLGFGVPILVAIFTIPLLIGVLGTERFGVLTLVWVVMNYFGLFDLGLGRATTKFVAEYHARNEAALLPKLIWSSAAIHLALGSFGGVLLAVLAPYLAGGFLNIPAALLAETKTSFYLLAASIPMVVVATALRGVLEALQRFDLVNLVKIPVSVATYLCPLAVALFTTNLATIVGALALTRVAMLLAYLFLCFRVLPVLGRVRQFSFASIKPLLGFGVWLSISTAVLPGVAALDRFLIGAFLSLSAVTYYVTPYEVVTKIWIFSGSLLAVLFPVFAALAAANVDHVERLRLLYERAFRYLLAMIVPMVGVLLALSYDLLRLWVGVDLAQNSAVVAKWVVVGVLIHALAAVPITALQGMGRADVAAKLQASSLVPYILAIYLLIVPLGITGVAAIWTLRILVEAAVLFFAASKLFPNAAKKTRSRLFNSKTVALLAFLPICFVVGVLPLDAFVLKVGLTAGLTGAVIMWEWSFFLRAEDRQFALAGLRPIFRRFG